MLVHLGESGTRHRIAVAGSTAAAAQCVNGIVSD